MDGWMDGWKENLMERKKGEGEEGLASGRTEKQIDENWDISEFIFFPFDSLLAFPREQALFMRFCSLVQMHYGLTDAHQQVDAGQKGGLIN